MNTILDESLLEDASPASLLPPTIENTSTRANGSQPPVSHSYSHALSTSASPRPPTPAYVPASSSPSGTTSLSPESVKWDPKPVANGSYANIFRGKWNGSDIALKQLKPHRKSGKAEKVSPCREASLCFCRSTTCSDFCGSQKFGAARRTNTFSRLSGFGSIPILTKSIWYRRGAPRVT